MKANTPDMRACSASITLRAYMCTTVILVYGFDSSDTQRDTNRSTSTHRPTNTRGACREGQDVHASFGTEHTTCWKKRPCAMEVRWMVKADLQCDLLGATVAAHVTILGSKM